jgi:hypothetical protein
MTKQLDELVDIATALQVPASERVTEQVSGASHAFDAKEVTESIQDEVDAFGLKWRMVSPNEDQGSRHR